MKCPKCGYLGFEHVDRCRNCGYDFSLAAPAPPASPDLSLKTPDAPEGPDDLSYLDSALPPLAEPERPDTGAPAGGHRAEASAESDGGDLPLFDDSIPDDLPLITKASPPRAPLAVRRATPEVPRVRSTSSRAPSLDFAFEEGPLDSAWVPPDEPAARPQADDAGIFARLAALAIDAAILVAIDLAVVYFTLQICGITLDDLAVVPRAPLIAFLVLQNGGYLVGFTAEGQTLGKMAMGIRVVQADGDVAVSPGRAFVRELTRVVLTLPAGLGLLPAVFSRDHRGVHDRFAGTRVVRA